MKYIPLTARLSCALYRVSLIKYPIEDNCLGNNLRAISGLVFKRAIQDVIIN